MVAIGGEQFKMRMKNQVKFIHNPANYPEIKTVY